MTGQNENALIADAMRYAENGFPVFPLHAVKDGKCTCDKAVCTSPAKHPRIKDGLNGASKDLKSVKNLFSCFTYAVANIGIRTGKESNLVVIDIDEAKGGNIADLYEYTAKETLENTLWVKTGGGVHLYFSYPPDAEIRNSADKLGNKIDVRSDGGYVVAPPSMHISGVRYEFLNQNHIQPLPPELMARITQSKSNTATKNDYLQKTDNSIIHNGNRNDSLTRIAGRLRRASLSQAELETSLLKINAERCKPPLPTKEVLQIARSVARYEIGQDAGKVFKSVQDADENFQSLFTIQGANVWLENAKLRPVPKMLFGEFWYEGELCILFADTGKGKSILAVQIGDAISRGASVGIFTVETRKQTVLYFDFELSDKQFEARYSIKSGEYFTNHYRFDENFQRGEINQNSIAPEGFRDFEDYLFYSLELAVATSETKILIVDNITYLRNATETAKDALPLMKELIRLKKKYGLSILALAHTPKRDLSKPLTVNDLQGSKMLSNFTDSLFAIGESAKDKNLRYLKQIKARNTEEIYHAENVATCQLTKPDNFLMFEFLYFGNEREHLKVLTDKDKTEMIEKVKSLSASGENQRNIARELGISLGCVNKYLKS